MLTNLSFLSLKRGGFYVWGPGLAKVGMLFAIGQVVAGISYHWLREPTGLHTSLLVLIRLGIMSDADSVRDLKSILFA